MSLKKHLDDLGADPTSEELGEAFIRAGKDLAQRLSDPNLTAEQRKELREQEARDLAAAKKDHQRFGDGILSSEIIQ